MLLFDFFGTLVEYSASRTVQRYDDAHEVLVDAGSTVGYDDFVGTWDQQFAELEAIATATGVEFSMDDVASAFARQVAVDLTAPQRSSLIDRYLDGWTTHVHGIDGVRATLDGLRLDGHRMAVVSNTHHAPMVHRLIDEHGLAGCFGQVITSVEVGARKPEPAVYAAATRALGVSAADCVFVGDSYELDYVGPRAFGMRAMLIDPTNRHAVVGHDRISSVLDVPDRL